MEDTNFRTEKELVAVGSRVLASRGLVEGTLGHVSRRVGSSGFLLRCRGPRERGLAWTLAEDVRVITYEMLMDGVKEIDGWSIPVEAWIHSCILERRPDVGSVVHAHPEATVVASISGVEVKPIVGAFDIPGIRVVARGVPVFERSILIRNRELGVQLAEMLGEKEIVVLRGHGIVTVGSDVDEAVLRALSYERLARLSLEVRALGREPEEIPHSDFVELIDLGDKLNREMAWRHEVSRLREIVFDDER